MIQEGANEQKDAGSEELKQPRAENVSQDSVNKTDSVVVKNKSTAKNEKFSYSYSNLADIAEAGVDIPEMRIKPTEHGEYIEYKDDKGDWQLGARIVELNTTRMNPAQAYGASLTYARRYTTMLAKRVACNDDDQIEDNGDFNESGNVNNRQKTNAYKLDFREIKVKIQQITTEAELVRYWKSLKLTNKQEGYLKPAFTKRKEQINAKNGN